MMKKLGIILLTIAFLFSTFSLLPVKRALCNRPDIALCTAEPWDWEYHSGKGGSGSSGGDNQRITDHTNRSVTQPSLNSPAQPSSYQRQCGNIIKRRNSSPDLKLKLLFFWQMISNK